LRVGPELGEFVWEDLDGDGVQDLDEFREELTPLEGEYVRSFVPGDALIPSVGVQGRLRLRLDGAQLAGVNLPAAAPGWRRALAAVTSLTTLDVQERTEADDAGVYVLSPWWLQQEGQTLNGRFRVGQELAFFRNRARYGGRLAASHLQALNRLSTGREARTIQTLEGEARAQVAPPLGLRLRAQVERNDADSPFASRTYAIRGLEAEPEATWTLSPNVTLTGGVRLARNRDTAGPDGLTARILILPVRARFAVANRAQLFLQAERADVALDGPALAAGQALFELTERRGTGVSYLWSTTGQYTLNAYLRASLTYEGRAPSAGPVVHNLRVQLSAVF
ncbi:MAG: hypothetical protein R3362_00605, partial [Rhodothermales bacterium]|nr:hypothetical protein [Rhodothermales bacterium]